MSVVSNAKHEFPGFVSRFAKEGYRSIPARLPGSLAADSWSPFSR